MPIPTSAERTALSHRSGLRCGWPLPRASGAPVIDAVIDPVKEPVADPVKEPVIDPSTVTYYPNVVPHPLSQSGFVGRDNLEKRPVIA